MVEKKPKIFIMSCLHPWNDTRIFFREARTLSTRYNVELHALANFKIRYYDGIKVVGLPNKTWWSRPLRWIRLIYRAFKSSAEIVHFHDPELLFVGIILRLIGKKVIYDVHEHVYQDILNKTWIPLLLRPLIAELYFFIQKLGERYLSAIITATETISVSFQKCRFTVIKNYPPLELFHFNEVSREPYTLKKTLNIIYVGTLNRTRGILHILKALNHLPADFSYKVSVVGAFSEGKTFEQEVMNAAFSIQDHLTFHGRLELPDALTLMKKAHIGLVCTQPTLNDLPGIPLKLFEYMAVGLAIVISNFPSWHTYVKNYPLHEFVDPTNYRDIARGIMELANRLHSSKWDWREVHNNVVAQYNWSSQGKRLLELYDSLL